MNVFLLTGASGTGKSYLAKQLQESDPDIRFIDLLVASDPVAITGTNTVIVDHVMSDMDFEKATIFANGVDNLLIIGQDERDFSTEFKNVLKLSGRPGQRLINIQTPDSKLVVKESELKNLKQLMP